jgi:outer membrane protein
MAMVTDTLDLEARVDALKADEIEAVNKVEVSREAISELVGREVREPFKRIAESPAFSLPAQAQDYWVQTALDSNPALHAREHSIRAAEAAIGEAKAGHLPKLGLNLMAQRSDIGYEGALAPRSDNLVASLDLQMPLYSGGTTRARVSTSESDKEAAQQELEALRRQVIKETRIARSNRPRSRDSPRRRPFPMASRMPWTYWTASRKSFARGVISISRSTAS